MEDKDPPMEFDKVASFLIEQLGKAFQELNDHQDSEKDSVQWVDLEEYFKHLKTMMQEKVEDLEIKKTQFGEKVSDARKLIAEREAVIIAKEQDLADRVQIIKDAAVLTIKEARERHQPQNIEVIHNDDNKESKVSVGAIVSENKTSEIVEKGPIEVNPRPELILFCEQMDANGLLHYCMENRIDLPTLRLELSVALEAATEPCQLVLASLDAAQKGTHDECCLMFLDALATLLARADHLLTIQIKLQAKRIADEWKPMLDAANVISLEEAEAFLQLIATFRLASEFNEEELCKLILVISHHRRAPELCGSLGLTPKIPGLIEDLINNGKQIEASRFIHAFQLDVQFPLVPLLKTYLKDLRRNSQGNRHHSSRNGPKIDGNAKELAGLKVVIECIENYKLEDEYPLDPLLVRVAQLDKPKSDKKRFPESGRYPLRKRSRPNRNGLVSLPLVAGGRSAVSINTQRPIYLNMPENMRYTHTGQPIYEYVAPPNQPLYQPPPNQPLYQPRNQPVYTQQVHAFNHVQDDQSAKTLYSTRTIYTPSSTSYDAIYGQQPPPHVLSHVQDDPSAKTLYSARTIYTPSSPNYDAIYGQQPPHVFNHAQDDQSAKTLYSPRTVYTPSSPSYDAIYGQQPPRKQYM